MTMGLLQRSIRSSFRSTYRASIRNQQGQQQQQQQQQQQHQNTPYLLGRRLLLPRSFVVHNKHTVAPTSSKTKENINNGTSSKLFNDDTSSTTTKREAASASASAASMLLSMTSSVRGIGQVMFMDDTKAGCIILAGLAVGDPLVAALGATGSVVSTWTASSLSSLSSSSSSFVVFGGTTSDDDKDDNKKRIDKTLQQGLLSYNGCLVGCAAAVFGGPTILVQVGATVTGAMLATGMTMAIGSSSLKLPQYTWAFNGVAFPALVANQQYQSLLLSSSTTSTTSTFVSDGGDSAVVVIAAAQEAVPTDGAAVTATATAAASSSMSWLSMDVLSIAPFCGMSQIFVIASSWTGVMLLSGIASVAPHVAVHALVGSTVGMITASILDLGSVSDISIGIWGYNSALTSMAIAVALKDSTATRIFSVVGSSTAAIVLSFMTPFLCEPLGNVPALTLPFCITASGCYALAASNAIPGIHLVFGSSNE